MPIVARAAPDRGRIDWKTERDRIDLAAVATRLLGPAPGRRGERGRRLWWCCPFHEDRNPSFCVEPGKPWWKCWGCGEKGDAATLVMKLQRVTFPEALAVLTGRRSAPRVVATPPRTAAPPAPALSQKGKLTPEAAAALADEAARYLQTPEEGPKLPLPTVRETALAYLTGRGLAPETIQAARLGWLPEGNPAVPWRAPGVVIPWHERGRVVLVKIRPDPVWRASLPSDRRKPPKYLEVFRDGPPGMYPSPETVRPGRPVVIVEGEFDALLLGQELGDLAAVVTLGSASAGPDVSILARLMTAPVWYIATDADDAGDKAAALWEAYPRAKRFRPPCGAKDWGELHAGGSNRIRYYWLPLLGWCGPTWEELAAERWGPGLDADTPEATDDPGADPYAVTERQAIQTQSDPT